MNLKIGNTTGLTLNENYLSGETYPLKEYIKNYLGGKWNSDKKAWAVNVEKVNDLIDRGEIYLDDSPAPAAKIKIAKNDGWCNRCQSWCYGDCTAN